MPGTLDLMGLNSPRILEGASGLGSQMSMWLGPPWRKTNGTDLALPQPAFCLRASGAAAAWAWSWRTSARLKPRMPTPPTRKNSRRLKPSQVLPDFPGIDNISQLLAVKQKCRAIEQSPGQVLGRFQTLAVFGEIDRGDLLGRRRSIDDGQVNPFNDFGVIGFRSDDFFEAIVGRVQRFSNDGAVNQVQGMR